MHTAAAKSVTATALQASHPSVLHNLSSEYRHHPISTATAAAAAKALHDNRNAKQFSPGVPSHKARTPAQSPFFLEMLQTQSSAAACSMCRRTKKGRTPPNSSCAASFRRASCADVRPSANPAASAAASTATQAACRGMCTFAGTCMHTQRNERQRSGASGSWKPGCRHVEFRVVKNDILQIICVTRLAGLGGAWYSSCNPLSVSRKPIIEVQISDSTTASWRMN